MQVPTVDPQTQMKKQMSLLKKRPRKKMKMRRKRVMLKKCRKSLRHRYVLKPNKEKQSKNRNKCKLML